MILCNAEPALPTTQMAEFSPSEAVVHLFRGEGT